MGVSCSADRNIKAKINKDGIWLEKLDTNPAELIPEEYRKPGEGGSGIEIDLDKGIDHVREELSKYPVSTRVNLNGTIIVARDIAHAKLKARLDAGEDMPQYFNALNALDAALRQHCWHAAYCAKIEASVLFAGVGHHLGAVAFGNHHERCTVVLELVSVVHNHFVIGNIAFFDDNQTVTADTEVPV